MRESCDVIVIGGGPSGLTAGAFLARAGRSVRVLDQGKVAGGYWTSQVHDGIVFDRSTHFTCEPERVNALLAELDTAPIDFERLPAISRYVGPKPGSDIWVGADRDRFERSVRSSFPDAGDLGLRRLVNLALAVDDELSASRQRSTGASDSALSESSDPLERLRAALTLPLRMKTVFEYAHVPARRLASRLFPGRSLHALRTALEMFAPYDGSGALGLLEWLAIGLRGKAHQPRGGAQVVADRLTSALLAAGGELRCGASVTRIRVEHGRAVGVSLADGTEIDAGAVVSAMDARQTFLALLPESVTPKSYTKRLGCASASASFFIVSVVADLDPAQHGADGTDVFLCKLDDARDLAAHPEKAISLSFPRYRHGPVSPGRHGVQIVCRAPAEFGARWSQLVCPERHVPTAAHCAVADGVAEKLVHEAEALLPGLSSRVVGTHVQTPITLYRDTRNERGAAVGWGWGTGQPGAAGGSPEERQRCGFVERLYHAGHWYGPSGIPAVLVSGRTAAGLCLSEWR